MKICFLMACDTPQVGIELAYSLSSNFAERSCPVVATTAK